MSLVVLRTVAEARDFCERARKASLKLSFVPTMGYLHEGHLSLMREGRRRADVCVASIFVNPTQFGPKEDLSRYPRDLPGDLAKCEAAGVSMVFAPEPSEMYPSGFQTWVEVTEVSQGLCGEKRPGHFRGVATVVTKLFNILRPDLALFGEKDYQQLQVIKTMTRDLLLGVEVVGMPTLREPDGLAMSSRNVYLSPDERQRALALSRGMSRARALYASGTRDVSALLAAMRDELSRAEVREDYVALVDASTLKPVESLGTQERGADAPARLLAAGFLGKTRLIDNMPLA